MKVTALLLAVWGFLSYIYQHYLDDSKSKVNKTSNNEASGAGAVMEVCWCHGVFIFIFIFIYFIYIYIYREREREREREKSKEISTENPGFEANVGSNSIWKLSPFIYLFLFFVRQTGELGGIVTGMTILLNVLVAG